MIKIAVIDDEPEIAEHIAEVTRIRAADLGIPIKVRTYYNGREFLEGYQPKMYDAVFLDIQMPDIDGDELSAQLNMIDSNLLLVYVTNLCNNEVYTMLKYMPIGFLRKPLFNDEIDSLLFVLQNKLLSLGKEYFVKAGKKFYRFSLPDLIFVESQLNYVYFHSVKDTKSKKKNDEFEQEIIKVRLKLDDVEKDIEQYGFIRTHTSFLVNYRYINSFEQSFVVLKHGLKVHVSRSYKAQAVKRFLYFSRSL